MKIEIINFAVMGDDDGRLIALEENKNIPFDIKRVYYIFDTKSGFVRGKHAHKNLQQILICVNGSCTILLDDGTEKVEVSLDCPNKGLIIKNHIWREMYNFSSDCVLMVLANQYYDEKDYIRIYQDFLDYVGNLKSEK